MSTTTTHTAVATREASELIAFVAEVVAVRVDGDDTGGAFAVLEHLLPGGLATPLHVQAHEDETFYVLDGELAVHLDGRESRAQTGDVIRLPRGLPHAFAVVSDGARLLALSTPAGHERFFRLAGDPAAAFALDDAAPPDVERMTRAAAATGVEILGPPPF